MVKINMRTLEGLTTCEIERELRHYAARGFKWRRCGWLQEDCQIWTPHFMVENQTLWQYFETLTRLEFGNTKQLEMLEAFNLMRLLYARNNTIYNSDKLLLAA